MHARLPRADALFGLATIALVASGCAGDATAPQGRDPGVPAFVEIGTQPAIRGAGTLGTGAATPGGDRQEFDFDVAADLAGSVFYRDWRATATLTVDPADPETRITAFRDGVTACAASANGAAFDAIGRRETGALQAFTVVACDDGAADSGADAFSLTTTDYGNAGRLTSGDIVKTVVTSPTSPLRVTALGHIGEGAAVAGADRLEFDFEATSAPDGRVVVTDYRVVRADGSPGRMIVDSETDPETGITSFAQTSATCVQFGGIGRINDNDQLFSFVIDACDRASPGAAADSFAITLPLRPYSNGGTLTGGDIVISTSEPSPGTGTLSISTTTTGESQPASYSVHVTGPSFPSGISGTIGANATVTATVAAGDYTLQLDGVPTHCTVDGGISRSVSVPSAATGSASYSVRCTTPPGNLQVTTTSNGSSIPSSYTVTVDANAGTAIPSTGGETFTDLAAGSHTVVLSVPNNCTVSGGATRVVTVPSGGTATVSYSVSCTSPNEPPIVNAGPDETVLVGALYGINVSFSDPNHNGPWSYTIDWGDGSRTTGTRSSEGTISAGHTYFTVLPRSFTIRVTVTDASGASGSDTKVVTVLLL